MAATDNPDFASLLRRYRRRRGLTQEILAERAGLSTASVSLLERGVTRAPQKATVEMLSIALGLPPEEATGFLARARRSNHVEQDDAPQRSAETTYDAGLPVPLTPLLGREQRAGGAAGAAGARDDAPAHADWPRRRRQDSPGARAGRDAAPRTTPGCCLRRAHPRTRAGARATRNRPGAWSARER